jgi:hypothetical protein
MRVQTCRSKFEDALNRQLEPANPFEIEVDLTPQGKIDELVFAKLKELNIEPAKACSDAVILRRVYLDTIGTLPTAEEAQRFLEDEDPNKRAVLIDHLLERPEYAEYWGMKWCDVLRVKSEFPINLWPNAAHAYDRWIRTSLAENMPYNQFVRELLTACGSNFRTPQVNFYRALQNKEPSAIAQAVALAFMGVRAEKWPQERLEGMAVFFAQIGFKPTREWKEEVVVFDPRKGKPTADAKSSPPKAAFPDGTPCELPAGEDPREVFADWLIDAENPWFARHIVNRMWYWLLGRGIVHEPDDMRPGNPPQNPELLDWLAEEPFTFIPEKQRSITLPDGSISSSVLEMFGRPPRDSGLAAERNNRITAAQALHLLNSTHVLRKIRTGPKIQELLKSTGASEMPRILYLTILSRWPTHAEETTASWRCDSHRGAEDFVWALINSEEFLFRH